MNDPTYRFLQTLPTDPRTLLNMIYTETSGHGQSPAQEAFVTIGDLLAESIAPPALSAALYRAAALIPGVTVIADVADVRGRHGVAVSITEEPATRKCKPHTNICVRLPGGPAYGRLEWIFDKTTMALRGEREIALPSGQIIGTTAILRRAIVDRMGEFPASR